MIHRSLLTTTGEFDEAMVWSRGRINWLTGKVNKVNSLNGHLYYKTDSSLRQTFGVGPCRFSVMLL